MFETSRVTQSSRTAGASTRAARIASAGLSGASNVIQWAGRLARWDGIRTRISSSSARALATYTTGRSPATRAASVSAYALLPLRAPPVMSTHRRTMDISLCVMRAPFISTYAGCQWHDTSGFPATPRLNMQSTYAGHSTPVRETHGRFLAGSRISHGDPSPPRTCECRAARARLTLFPPRGGAHRWGAGDVGLARYSAARARRTRRAAHGLRRLDNRFAASRLLRGLLRCAAGDTLGRAPARYLAR